MGKAYSLDFRIQVLKSFRKKRVKLGVKTKGKLKKSINYILKFYNISRGTLFNWLKREKEGILDNNNKNSGNRSKIDKIKLNELMDSGGGKDLTLKEIANLFNVHPTTIYYYFLKNRFTFKKNSYAIEKVIQ
jgi:transposase